MSGVECHYQQLNRECDREREEQRRERLLGCEFRVGKQVIDYKGNHNLIRVIGL